jgi:SPP1 gp7 family putative phage head morphogenesis protein
LWGAWADEIVGLTTAASSPDQVSMLLSEWAERAEHDNEIALSLYRAQLHADMGGQLFVRTVEVPEAGGPVELADGGSAPAFLRMPFREAIEAFLRRRIVDPEVFEAMSAAAKLRAFTATRLAARGLIDRARELLARALREGGTLRDFQRELDVDDLGVTAASSGYLETVYRTNVQMAYGQGRLTQLEHPDVVTARPLVQYRTAGDNRVRPAHAALDRVVFDRSRDSGWRRYAPPLGYNCRCAMVTLRELGDERTTHSGDLDVGPDPEWAGPGASDAL